MKSGNPKIAVGYIRVSTTEQHLGLEAQKYAVEEWARRRDIMIADILVDRLSGGRGMAASGTELDLTKRPALMEAIERLSEVDAGVLLLAKRDRLARDSVMAGLLDRVVAKKGARIVSADGIGVDDSPAGRFQRTIMDATSEYERALIRARTTAALAAKRRKGEKTGGAPPYGWRSDGGDPPRLSPHPEEQEVIRRIEAWAAEGVSRRATARRLTEARIPARGTRWHPTTVQRILNAATAEKGFDEGETAALLL